MGIVGGVLGLEAYRLEKLIKALKANGILDADYEEECLPLVGPVDSGIFS